MTDRDTATKRLREEGFTCVLQCGETVFTSRLRGVRPLLEWLEAEEDLRGFAAADKVVGRATAFLYVLLGVRSLYAGVISSPALQVLRAHHVDTAFGEEVAFIRNRAGDGVCPFEEAVLGITEPAEALEAIRRRRQQMASNERKS